MLLRLREPTEGRVLLGGTDVRELGQEDVRRAVSGCRQDPWLFARTLLLVTHRLSGLDAVDEVVVLDRGRVVQRGTAAELRQAPGPYRDLERAEREADALLTTG